MALRLAPMLVTASLAAIGAICAGHAYPILIHGHRSGAVAPLLSRGVRELAGTPALSPVGPSGDDQDAAKGLSRGE
jgi:hypothetical protein